MSSADKATWRGCLKPGPTAGTWMLEDAEASNPASAKSPVGTAGAAASKSTFLLSTKPGEDLKAHANHKIEVVGTITAASAGAGAAPGAPKQTFNVDSFKMVSTSCP